MSGNITVIGDENSSKSKVKFLGIPIESKCHAESLFYGIIGGITGGLTTYLFTSQPRISSHVGAGCYVATTLIYAAYCLEKQRQIMKQMRLMQKTMYEATHVKTVDDTLDEHKPKSV